MISEIGILFNKSFGIEMHQEGIQITMYQRRYIEELLQRFEMSDCNPLDTHLDPNSKRNKKEDPSDKKLRLPYREGSI